MFMIKYKVVNRNIDGGLTHNKLSCKNDGDINEKLRSVILAIPWPIFPRERIPEGFMKSIFP